MMKVFRVLAGILALGGITWGALLLGVMIEAKSFHGLLLFGPGYAVTIGYVCRALLDLSLGWRRVVWGSSSLVQGAWFFVSILGGRTPVAFLLWWLVAFIVSVLGFFADGMEDDDGPGTGKVEGKSGKDKGDVAPFERGK
jgi:hypothetical protein